MTYLQEGIPAERQFLNDDDWLHSDVPAELAQTIADEYGEEDRRSLATAASQAALEEIGEAYTNPFVRHAAHSAVQMALGLKPLPAEQEGEN